MSEEKKRQKNQKSKGKTKKEYLKYLLILGKQGSGKGTQASKIEEEMGIPHINAGELLRKEITQGTKEGKKIKNLVEKGKLVDDETINRIVQKAMEKNKWKKKGFVLDGYPRTEKQKKSLEKYLDKNKRKIEGVIQLNLSEKEVYKRTIYRRICEKNHKHEFNLKTAPPKKKGRCDICGGRLIQRKDDTREAVKKRLEEYKKRTAPLLKKYKKIIIRINGEQPEDQVFNEIKKKLRKKNQRISSKN